MINNLVKSDKLYKNLLFIILSFLTILYIYSISKDPILGDSLTFTIQANKGFELESNATNHFLYTNLLALFHKIIPFIDVHYLFVGVSIFSGILSLYYLQKLLFICGVSPKSSILCILIFGLSFTFWRLSIITEVYTFYLFFVILFLINVFKFLRDKNVKNFYYLSILFGVLFLIHIQTILFIPLYCYIILRNYSSLKEHAIYGILISLAIFSVLLIPVVLGSNTFTSIFTDDAYQDSIFNFAINTILKSVVKNIGFFVYNFLFFIIFLFLGFKNKKGIDYIAIAVLPFIFFCIKHNVSDIYVFHLVPYIFVLIFMGRGMGAFPKTSYLFLPFLFPIIYFITFKSVKLTTVGDNIEKEKGFKGGTRYLLFPPLNENPDLSVFIEKYYKDSLNKKPELQYMYPFAIEWEKIKK